MNVALRWWCAASALLAFASLAQAQADATQAERVQRYRDIQKTAGESLQRVELAMYKEYERMLAIPGQTAAAEDLLFHAMLRTHELDMRRVELLRAEMIGILGDKPPEGFEAESRLNAWSVLPQIGMPALDGLAYKDATKKGSVIVVPVTLFESWLQGPRWAGKPRPQAMAQALDSPDLYLNTGEYTPWATAAARLPVRIPAGAEQAGALLMDSGQPIYYLPPSHIVVAVIDRDRVYIANQEIQTRLPGADKCAKRHWDFVHRQLVKEADAGYRACYTQVTRNRPEFAQAAQEAQALIDRLRPPETSP